MEKQFLIEYERIASEWDFDKNQIDIREVRADSTYMASWKCEKGHEWKAKVVSRIKRNSSCQFCIGRRAITGENDVATLYPYLAEEFHPTKNGNVRLDALKESSGKKVWWICKHGHEWEAVINTRTKRGYKCPVCSGQKIIPGINDFLTIYPEFAKEVHPDTFKAVDLGRIGGKSTKAIKWICKEGHSYETSIAKRTVRGDGCPVCAGRYALRGENDIKTLLPELEKYWDYENNNDMSMYKPGSTIKANWRCEKGHNWINKISNQVRNNECPYCSGKLLVKGVNDLQSVYPDLAEEWDEVLNEKKADAVKYSAHTKGYWKCKYGHIWKAEMFNRVRGKGCPYCSGKKAIKGENDLKTLYPFLVSEWDYERNKIGPENYLPKSNIKAWWRCKHGHSWRALISERTRGTGCPFCKE